MMTNKRTGTLWAPLGLAAIAAVMASGAQATEIEPYEYVALPAGTNLLAFYGYYGRHDQFQAAGQPTQDASLDSWVGVGKAATYFDLGGKRALVSVVQIFGSSDDLSIGGGAPTSGSGLGDTILGAAYWPVSNDRTNFAAAVYVTLPTGDYDRGRAVNMGGNRVVYNPGVSLHQKIDERWSVDFGADVFLYGDNADSGPAGQTFSQDASYQFQAFANYQWASGLTTSIGYQAFRGGAQQLEGVDTGGRTDFDEVRFSVGQSVTPQLHLLGEVSHQFASEGGFRQNLGLMGRIVYAF